MALAAARSLRPQKYPLGKIFPKREFRVSIGAFEKAEVERCNRCLATLPLARGEQRRSRMPGGLARDKKVNLEASFAT
jgi:hypothetical protein